MGFLDALKSALGLGGGPAGGVDRGLYVYVQCNRCKDVVRVRINVANEVSELGEESDEGDTELRASGARYAVRKGVVDSKCFRPMTLMMHFDGRRRELDRGVEGGTIVDEAAWEAARAARQQPG